jgi:hypothetical protein
MARYLATSIPPRAELLPDHDDEVDLAVEALLDENERRKLQSYRPPSNVDELFDQKPTIRWSAAEIQSLLAIAQATVEPHDDAAPSSCRSTVPPGRTSSGDAAVRRSEVVMTSVRGRGP